MSPGRRALVAICALVVVGATVATAVAANDVDTSRTGRITITVKIDVVGGEPDIVERWKDAIEDYWNNGPGLGRFEYCDKRVEFVADIQPIAAGQAGRADAHKIRMRLLAPGRDITSNVVWPRGTRPPAGNAGGTWGSNESDEVIAHEFGHLLGLPDEYFHEDRNRNGRRDPGEPTHPKPEFRDGSLMAGPGGKALQRHIDEAMNFNGVPPCEERWEGTTTIRNQGQGINCRVRWNVEFTVFADKSLDGTIEEVSDSCGGGESGALAGRKENGRFLLIGRYARRTLPIADGRVSVTLHPHPVTTETWSLRCVNCG